MSRSVDLREILIYKLRPLPLSLAKPKVNENKTTKSKSMQELEVESSVNEIYGTGKESSCLIIDLLALVQIVGTQNSVTFGDLATFLA